jgi:putative transposase
MIGALRRVVQRVRYPLEVMLVCVRWYAAYRLSFRNIEEKITIDQSGSNTAAIASIQADSGLPIEMRQSKYLNKLVEQDHRAVKRIIRPMLGFKTFHYARILIASIGSCT